LLYCFAGLGKSESDAIRWRELGNQSFKKGHDRKALEQYTLSMHYAPKPTEKRPKTKKNSFTIGIANRFC